MQTPLTPIKDRLTSSKTRPWLLSALVLLIIIQLVALNPKPLEKESAQEPITHEEILSEKGTEKPLAPAVPEGVVADYTLDNFKYASTDKGVKQWRIIAKQAFFYNASKLVHSKVVTAHLFGADGKITIVRGKEAQYFLDKKDLEVFGDVEVEFPDGFTTRSQYMRYLANDRRVVIPPSEHVTGGGVQPSGDRIDFECKGLVYEMSSAEVRLHEAVIFTLTGKNKLATGQADTTVIESDTSLIQRQTKLEHFTMREDRKHADRFIRITQPTMFTRSRRAQLNYGESKMKVTYLTALEDVLIKEKGKPSLRYGTSGKADFDGKRNVVILTQFPQVYQDNDTVTGEVIVVHRDSDIVEVEHSNAFNSGSGP